MRPLLVLVALLLAGCAVPAPGDGPPPGEAMVSFPGIRVETRAGAFTAIVFEDETPQTAAFFLGLVDRGYYDGRAFGRVIPGFVIQEVDRTGGTTDQAERVPLEAPTRVMFSAGAFGIARDEDPDSGGSEFFVMDHAVSPLYGNYSAFAQVVEGLDAVHAIARVPAVKTGGAFPPAPTPVQVGVHDRVPVDPVTMRITRVTVNLTAEEAARYPLVVGETVRTDTLRATLEWPRDLRAGFQSDLSWYVAARSTSPDARFTDPPPVDLRGATLRVLGPDAEAVLGWEEMPSQSGHVRFPFQPPAAGEYVFVLERDGKVLVESPPVAVPR